MKETMEDDEEDQMVEEGKASRKSMLKSVEKKTRAFSRSRSKGIDPNPSDTPVKKVKTMIYK